MAVADTTTYRNIAIDSTGPWPTSLSPARLQQAQEIYVADVVRELKRMAGTVTGQAVLADIARAPKTMTIRPMLIGSVGYSRQNGLVSASVNADDPASAAPTGRPIRCQAAGCTAQIGTGTGSDTTLWYWAAIWKNRIMVSGIGSKADEVLLHEMIHGLRDLWGRTEIGRNLDNAYGNVEEFYAIMVTNIYMSERGASVLRGEHGGAGPMIDDEPRTFLADHFALVTEFVRLHPILSKQIAAARSRFNPLRDYDRSRRRVR